MKKYRTCKGCKIKRGEFPECSWGYLLKFNDKGDICPAERCPKPTTNKAVNEWSVKSLSEYKEIVIKSKIKVRSNFPSVCANDCPRMMKNGVCSVYGDLERVLVEVEVDKSFMAWGRASDCLKDEYE